MARIPRMTPKRKEENARRATQTIQHRILWVMGVFGVACFVALFIKLYNIQITQHEMLQEKAVDQQTLSTTISASRGTIYDRNGNVLATSATAETIFISPKEIAERSEKENEATGENATYLKNQYKEYVTKGLARILGLEEEDILKDMEKTNSQYEVLATKVEKDVADEVRRFINGEIDANGNKYGTPEDEWISLRGIYLADDSKRYYPYHSLAAHVIGFVNAANEGAYGTEAVYNSELQGSTGLTISAKDVNGQELLYQYEQYYDAENGNNLITTLDTTIQYYLERGLEEAIAKYDVENGGTAICLDPTTGAILGMASSPTYDLENYSEIYSQLLKDELAAYESSSGTDSQAGEDGTTTAQTGEDGDSTQTTAGVDSPSDAYLKKLGELQKLQWRNKCINDTYEPGSTFKILTLSMALEEGATSMSTTYNCQGYLMVPGWSQPIHCDKRTGHGLETLKEATANSCNPAFMTMALNMGTDTFYDYLEAFGLKEATGVDLQGEQKGVYASRENFNTVDLATYSFGQNFTVTPLQLLAAQAACINGGYLYTPYLVERIEDSNGNIISQHDATPVRQVISEETSAQVREILEYVVKEGSGRNGQVAGYRIGGKTGTADKLNRQDVVVSFVCFAPADDPQVMVLMTLDTPGRDTGTYVSGGQMVAPVVSSIMAEILPHLGIEPTYTAEEVVGADATVPNVVGLTKDAAVAKLAEYGFASYTIEGDGDTVTDQTPLGGAIVPGNANIILYMGEEKPDDLCKVPNVIGKTASQANKALSDAGLIMKVSGATNQSSSTVIALSQSVEQGSMVDAGTVVEVRFGDTSVRD